MRNFWFQLWWHPFSSWSRACCVARTKRLTHQWTRRCRMFLLSLPILHTTQEEQRNSAHIWLDSTSGHVLLIALLIATTKTFVPRSCSKRFWRTMSNENNWCITCKMKITSGLVDYSNNAYCRCELVSFKKKERQFWLFTRGSDFIVSFILSVNEFEMYFMYPQWQAASRSIAIGQEHL